MARGDQKGTLIPRLRRGRRENAATLALTGTPTSGGRRHPGSARTTRKMAETCWTSMTHIIFLTGWSDSPEGVRCRKI